MLWSRKSNLKEIVRELDNGWIRILNKFIECVEEFGVTFTKGLHYNIIGSGHLLMRVTYIGSILHPIFFQEVNYVGAIRLVGVQTSLRIALKFEAYETRLNYSALTYSMLVEKYEILSRAGNVRRKHMCEQAYY